jgi:nitrite reductase (NO-forming)
VEAAAQVPGCSNGDGPGADSGSWRSLAACDARPPAASDPYDPATIDLKSPPARVTNTRPTGAFAAGNALSMTAVLKPLDPAPAKDVRLDATHKIIEISPGVKFTGWTFGDQVPGPTIRARVGDRIRFTMTNRSDESVPGVRVTSAPMMHSRRQLFIANDARSPGARMWKCGGGCSRG